MAVRRIFVKQKPSSLEVIGAHPTVAYTDFSGTKKLNVLLPLIGQYFKKSRGYLPPLPPPTPLTFLLVSWIVCWYPSLLRSWKVKDDDDDENHITAYFFCSPWIDCHRWRKTESVRFEFLFSLVKWVTTIILFCLRPVHETFLLFSFSSPLLRLYSFLYPKDNVKVGK